jgi:type I restriction enzyme S subunit
MNLNYLYYYMLSQEFLKFATTAGERSVLPKINQKSMEVIPVPVPSSQEQTEIVRRVENLFAKADAIEEKYKQLKEKIENLPQAVLAKAFRGEI